MHTYAHRQKQGCLLNLTIINHFKEETALEEKAKILWAAALSLPSFPSRCLYTWVVPFTNHLNCGSVTVQQPSSSPYEWTCWQLYVRKETNKRQFDRSFFKWSSLFNSMQEERSLNVKRSPFHVPCKLLSPLITPLLLFACSVAHKCIMSLQELLKREHLTSFFLTV